MHSTLCSYNKTKNCKHLGSGIEHIIVYERTKPKFFTSNDDGTRQMKINHMHINEKSKTWMVSFEYLQCKNHIFCCWQSVSRRKEGCFIFKFPMSVGVITGTSTKKEYTKINREKWLALCTTPATTKRYNILPSCTSMPSARSSSRSFRISSLSSRISLALASSLTTALHTICLARSAYLWRRWQYINNEKSLHCYEQRFCCHGRKKQL